jgi:hypothetical protein
VPQERRRRVRVREAERERARWRFTRPGVCTAAAHGNSTALLHTAEHPRRVLVAIFTVRRRADDSVANSTIPRPALLRTLTWKDALPRANVNGIKPSPTYVQHKKRREGTRPIF